MRSVALIRDKVENHFGQTFESEGTPTGLEQARVIYLRSGVIYRRSTAVGGGHSIHGTGSRRRATPVRGHSDSFEPPT